MVAALLLVAAGVTFVQYQRQGDAGPPAGPDDPPSGVQLIYLRDASRSHWVVAYDWSGARRGSIQLPSWFDVTQLRASPDGSGFMLDPQSVGDYAAYFDRLGRTRVETDDSAFASQVWAADARNVCVLDLTETGMAVITRSAGSPDRIAHVVPAPRFPGSGPLTILACSLRNDVAIVQLATRVLRLKLSSGAVQADVDLGADTVVASSDGAYIAAGSTSSDSAPIYRTSDLTSPVAVLAASVAPLAFSGDDSSLLTSAPLAGGSTLRVIDWRTGKATWSRGLTTPFGPWMARPSSQEFVIAVGGGAALIARRDGTTTVLTGDHIAW